MTGLAIANRCNERHYNMYDIQGCYYWGKKPKDCPQINPKIDCQKFLFDGTFSNTSFIAEKIDEKHSWITKAVNAKHPCIHPYRYNYSLPSWEAGSDLAHFVRDNLGDEG